LGCPGVEPHCLAGENWHGLSYAQVCVRTRGPAFRRRDGRERALVPRPGWRRPIWWASPSRTAASGTQKGTGSWPVPFCPIYFASLQGLISLRPRRRGGGGNRTRVLRPPAGHSPSAASEFCRPPARHWLRQALLASLGFPFQRLAHQKGQPRIMTPAPGSQGLSQTDGPLIKQPALDALCLYWRLLVSQLFYVASGDHGSLLPGRQPKSKPVTPMSMC
jgi:hypothetical protein